MINDFSFRNTEETDYKILCDWWKWHRFPAPPRKILPNNISDGIMVSFDNQNICAGFIYSTSSSCLFHIEWIVSSYLIKDRLIRKQGIGYLIEGLEYMGKNMGAEHIYTSLINKKLIESFENKGWTKGSINTTEMIKTIF